VTCNAPALMGWSPAPSNVAALGSITPLCVTHSLRKEKPRGWLVALQSRRERRGAPWRSSHLIVRSRRLRSVPGLRRCTADGVVPYAEQQPRLAGATVPAAQFRTIQVYPKDLRVLPDHPQPAVSLARRVPGGAHVRPQATPVHRAMNLLEKPMVRARVMGYYSEPESA
jgi:hypothetical protein